MKTAIQLKQQQLLSSHLPVSILTGYLGMLFMLAILWAHSDRLALTYWLILFNLIMVFRIGVYLYRRSHSIELSNLILFTRLNLFSTLATGLIWGSAAFYYEVTLPLESQVSIWVLLVALMSGASASFSVDYKYYLYYAVPIIALASYSMSRHELYYLLTLFLLYSGLLSLTAYNFYKSHLHIMQSQAALEGENEELYELATKDSLTDLPNRRSFDEYFRKIWARHCRHHTSLSLMMIDVDYFKNYNDNYGHDKGDQCLIALAEVLNDSLKRDSDMVARYGGEEFILLLPGLDAVDTKLIASDIQDRLREKAIPHEHSDASKYLTVSIGIASLQPERGQDRKILQIMADRELYKAKAQGRNTISVA